MTTGIATHRPARTRLRLVAGAAGSALALGLAVPVPTASAAGTGGISGVVTGVGDALLEGITVEVYGTPSGGPPVATGETGADGTYEIEGIEVGAGPNANKVTIRFSDPTDAYATEYWDDAVTAPPYARWVTIPDGDVTPDIDATLEPAGSISGRLTNATGEPVAFGAVSLWWQVGPQSFSRVGDHVADEDGFYSIRGIKPESYGLVFSDPATGAGEAWNNQSEITSSTPIHVGTDEDVTGIDAVLGGVVKSTTTPAITGTPQVGSTLTAASGWSPSGTVASYRWVVGDDSNPADDPTGATYVPTPADLGKTIRVVATGTHLAGWIPATATSAPTAPVAAAPAPVVPTRLSVANLRLPLIKGRLVVGKRVRVTTGTWTPATVELEYRWFAGKQAFRTSDRPWVRLTRKQAGKRLRVEVTAVAAGHEPLTVRTKRTKAKVAPKR